MVTIFSSQLFVVAKMLFVSAIWLSKIITDKWYEDRQVDFCKESERIVETAANLIKACLRETVYNMSEYPKASSMDDLQEGKQWVPPLLMSFMQTLVSDELKQISLCHSIIQASRPRLAISPTFVELRSFYRSHCLDQNYF
jgi:hypothetical protein